MTDTEKNEVIHTGRDPVPATNNAEQPLDPEETVSWSTLMAVFVSLLISRYLF